MGRTLDLIFGKAPAIAPRSDVEPPASTSGGIEIPARASLSRTATVRDALSLSHVFRSVHILAVSGKQLSLGTMRGDDRIPNHYLVRNPDADEDVSRSKWIERSITSLALTGNCYYEKLPMPDGTVASLRILNPVNVRILTDTNNRVTGYAVAGREKPLAPNRVKHLTLLSIPGIAYGLGPIQAANPELVGAIDTRDYASNWFDSSGQPSGILTSDQTITREKANEAKEWFLTSSGARKGPIVLGQGLNYAPVFINPKDAQFIESQQFSQLAIANMFGIPSSLLNVAVEGSSQTYSNVEQKWIEFTKFTLAGYLVEIEDAITALLPGQQRAVFNIDALHRSDIKTRYQAHKIAIEMGLYDAPYARRIENIPEDAITTTQEPANV